MQLPDATRAIIFQELTTLFLQTLDEAFDSSLLVVLSSIHVLVSMALNQGLVARIAFSKKWFFG